MTLTKNQLETRGDGEEGTEGNDNLQKRINTQMGFGGVGAAEANQERKVREVEEIKELYQATQER